MKTCITNQLKTTLGLVLFMQNKAQMVKNLLAMQETRVQSPGQEDPLEKEIATHSSILAWEIPQTEETGSPWGCKRVSQDIMAKQ